MLHWIYTSKLPFLFLILLILFYSVSWTSFITCRISWRLLFLSCLCTDNNTGLHPGELFVCCVSQLTWLDWVPFPGAIGFLWLGKGGAKFRGFLWCRSPLSWNCTETARVWPCGAQSSCQVKQTWSEPRRCPNVFGPVQDVYSQATVVL